MDSSAEGARRAFKGFRWQGLCALSYYFQEPDASIQLEGEEDFVLRKPGVQPRYYQVKTGKAINLSTILDTYISRVEKRTDPRSEFLLLFTPPGPELLAAWARSPKELASVVSKIANSLAISTERAQEVFLSITPVVLKPEDVIVGLHKAIGTIQPFGAVDLTLDLLLMWIYYASEASRQLHPGFLEERQDLIRRHWAHLSDSERHWHSTIVPLYENLEASDQLEALATDYREGLGAKFAHITASLDIPRKAALSSIQAAFENRKVVVIRGASGQGKTSLAYRYLLDHCLPHFRFQLYLQQGVTVLREVFVALEGRLSALQCPIYCLIDVEPGTSDWVNMVAHMSSNPLIKVLICIRHDDWNRATVGARFPAPEIVDLHLQEDEARELFDNHQATGPRQFPDFDDAWRRFGSSPGPLLEFAYLLNQGTTLRSRLKEQVQKLKATERELLRQVALADCCGSEFHLSEQMDLSQTQVVVEKLERELLLRATGRTISGLHPVRSRILCEELHCDIVPVERTALQILPCIPERNLEIALLTLFKNWPNSREPLLAYLCRHQFRSWDGCGSTLKSLLWLGVLEELERNVSLRKACLQPFDILSPGEGGPLRWRTTRI